MRARGPLRLVPPKFNSPTGGRGYIVAYHCSLSTSGDPAAVGKRESSWRGCFRTLRNKQYGFLTGKGREIIPVATAGLRSALRLPAVYGQRRRVQQKTPQSRPCRMFRCRANVPQSKDDRISGSVANPSGGPAREACRHRNASLLARPCGRRL